MMDTNNTDDSLKQPRVLKLLQEMLALHEAEMDCEACGERIDCLAELLAIGTTLGEQDMLPAVQNHIECCRDCREEFNALLAILRAEHSGQLPIESDKS